MLSFTSISNKLSWAFFSDFLFQFHCSSCMYILIVQYSPTIVEFHIFFRIRFQDELKRAQAAEREKRAAAAETRIAAAAAQGNSASSKSGLAGDINCSCCNVSLAGKVPFHRYNYKYCSTSCMHVHREVLEDG